VVWGVAPALHSPLMSVTNAISGIIGVGGLYAMGGGYLPETIPQTLGALSVLLAFVNISGGFVISKRMLDMFRRPTDPKEYPWLYAVPAALFGGGFIAAASTGMAGLVQAGYLVSSVLCVTSLSGLASQTTGKSRLYEVHVRRLLTSYHYAARRGNFLGILGVFSGFLASLAAVGFSSDVLTQFAGLATVGTVAGLMIGRRITPTSLPQTVAALHSVVGLAAVLTSIGSVLGHSGDISTLHMVSAYLGVLIGGVTFTGSIVAFLKLAAKMSSKPLALPGRHLINSTLLGANVATMGAFLTYAPGAPLIGAACLVGNAALSFVKGYTTTAAIGGADMPVVITVLNAYSGFALVAEGFMLDNPLLTSVGKSWLYEMHVRHILTSYLFLCRRPHRGIRLNSLIYYVRCHEPKPYQRALRRYSSHSPVPDQGRGRDNEDHIRRNSRSSRQRRKRHHRRRLRHGRVESAVRTRRLCQESACERHQRALCHSSSRRPHARTVQRAPR